MSVPVYFAISIQRRMVEHQKGILKSGMTFRLRQRNCDVDRSRAAPLVTSNNCSLGEVGYELIILCLSSTSLPFLVGLSVRLQNKIDASLLDTEARRVGCQQSLSL